MVAGRSAVPAWPCGSSRFMMFFQIRADKIDRLQCSDSCNQKMARTKGCIRRSRSERAASLELGLVSLQTANAKHNTETVFT